MDRKQCKICGETKALEDFYATKGARKTYHMNRCKKCHVQKTSARVKREVPRVKKSLDILPEEKRAAVLQFVGMGEPPNKIAKLTGVPYRDLMRWKYAGKLPYPDRVVFDVPGFDAPAPENVAGVLVPVEERKE